MCNNADRITIKGWITDGSPVVFSDTIRLKTETKKFIGHRRYFEGLIDDKIMLGTGSIPWEEGGHDAELEWVLLFEKPISKIIIDENTECVLQGMIEGKNLRKLLGTDQIAWAPASIGNNIISTKDGNQGSEISGIKIKLDDLRKNQILATMKLTYKKEDGEHISERIVQSDVLCGLPIIEFLNDLKATASSIGFEDGRVVNLGAWGDQSGYVNERKRQIKAMLKSLLVNNEFERALDYSRNLLIQNVIDNKEGMCKIGVAELTVFEGITSKVIGMAKLQTV